MDLIRGFTDFEFYFFFLFFDKRILNIEVRFVVTLIRFIVTIDHSIIIRFIGIIVSFGVTIERYQYFKIYFIYVSNVI